MKLSELEIEVRVRARGTRKDLAGHVHVFGAVDDLPAAEVTSAFRPAGKPVLLRISHVIFPALGCQSTATGLVLISGGDDTSDGPVSSYVAAIEGLKADPDNQIVAMGVVGPSSPRLSAFVWAFRSAQLVSISDDSFTPVVTSLCAQLPILHVPPCIPAAARNCTVTEHLTTADGERDLLLPACSAPSSAVPCWSELPAPLGCAGPGVVVQNQPTGSDPAHYSVQGTISCEL
jgi:hypothetical protein